MTPRLREFEDRASAAEALAGALHAGLGAALAARGTATLVVSGGTTPAPMFRLLRDKPLAWNRIDVLASDERDVPPDHTDRNEGMIRRELLQGPAAAARLVSLIPPGEIPERFHAVVLGMGVDGHTASLFPSSPDLQAALESDDALHRLSVPGLEADRVSLTPRALLSSRRIDLLFFGEEKRAVFEQAARPGDPAEFPVRAVLEQDERSIVTIKHVTGAEEYLQDHFAGFPVLPGVMMLEAMVQAAVSGVEMYWSTSTPMALMPASQAAWSTPLPVRPATWNMTSMSGSCASSCWVKVAPPAGSANAAASAASET